MNKYIFIIVSFLFLAASNAYALPPLSKLYLKAELPLNVYIDSGRLDTEDKKDLTVSNQFTLGVGYQISPRVEIELGFNKLQSFFKWSDADSTYFGDAHGKDTKFMYVADARPETSARNLFARHSFGGHRFIQPDSSGTKTSSTILEGSALCTALNYTPEKYALTKTSVMIAAVKFYPIKLHKIINPYISMGGGMALHKNLDIEQYSAAMELGAGIKISITERLNLEASAKYFDYGKYNILRSDKKFTGYKLAVGISLRL